MRFIYGWILFGAVACTSFLQLRPSVEWVVVATSDFHAALSRAEGLTHRMVSLQKQYGNRMLYLDGGDFFQGSLEGDEFKGKPIIQLFNFLKLDAAAIGNHDLDYGPDVPGRVLPQPGEDPVGALKQRSKEARFQWLSANWIWKNSISNRTKNALQQDTVFQPHAIFNRAGHKICVIGATTPSTASKVVPAILEGTEFTPLLPVVQAEAHFLRQQLHCDLVLLVAHAGLVYQKNAQHQVPTGEIVELARALPAGSIDAIVAGHTHICAQTTIQGIPILQAGSDGKYVGVLHLDITHQKPPRFDEFLEVPSGGYHAGVSRMLQVYREKVGKIKKQKVTRADEVFFKTPKEEGPLGNLVADALLDATRQSGAVVAFLPMGTIRNSLPTGVILAQDVYKALPFRNSPVLVQMTGAELRRSIEIAMSGEMIAAFSGIKIQLLKEPILRDLNGDGKQEPWEANRVAEIFDANNRPIDPHRTYSVVTLDYYLHGGDHQDLVFSKIPKSRVRHPSVLLLRDLVVEFLKKRKRVHPRDFWNPAHLRIIPFEGASRASVSVLR